MLISSRTHIFSFLTYINNFNMNNLHRKFKYEWLNKHVKSNKILMIGLLQLISRLILLNSRPKRSASMETGIQSLYFI